MVMWVLAPSTYDVVKFASSSRPVLPPIADGTAGALFGIYRQHPHCPLFSLAHQPAPSGSGGSQLRSLPRCQAQPRCEVAAPVIQRGHEAPGYFQITTSTLWDVDVIEPYPQVSLLATLAFPVHCRSPYLRMGLAKGSSWSSATALDGFHLVQPLFSSQLPSLSLRRG